MIRTALLAFALVVGAATPLAAQAGAGGAQDTITVKGDTIRAATVEERARAKLRALERASRPKAPAEDTSTAKAAPADSVAQREVAPGGVDPAHPARVDSAGRPVPAAVVTEPSAGDTIPPTTPAGETAAAVIAGPPIRFGTAPFAGVIPASDTVLARLRALEGYVVTEYRAANARYDRSSGRLDLEGEPQLQRGTESMKADSLLRYDERTSIVCGYGKPLLSGTGNDPVESELVCYDVNRQVGVAHGARTSFQQQGTWYVHGTELYTSGKDRLYGSATSFTTCELEEPHFHFSASELKVVHKSVMVARNVTLRFADVPVLWLPFIVQSLKPDRRSGILTPTIGLQHVVRTSSGYRREIRDIGFYWSINDHLGLTTAMDWQSGSYIALRGRLQYKWLRQFLNGDVSFSRFWESDGATRFALSGRSSWQPGERTSLNASVNYASSTAFVRRYSVDPEELNRSIDSNVGLSHRFNWGSLNLSGSRRQHLSDDRIDLTLPSVTLSLNPITLFPATGEAKWFNNATWQSNASFTASSREVDYTRPTEREQNRADLQGRVDTRLTMGKLSWNSAFNFNESLLRDRPTWYDPNAPAGTEPDSVVYSRAVTQRMSWETGLSFTQRLIENTHFSPSVSLRGGMQLLGNLPDSLGIDGRVAEPTRLNVGASLRTNIFGFWPGFGPYSRLRHRIEPSLSYSYSPAPNVTELQRKAFGSAYDGLRENNQITLTVSQTFEAKPVVRDTASRGAAQDTVTGAFGEAPPRRTMQVQPITLLSISSSALVYDFARRRNGEYGLTTTQMSHSIRSDLVKGLSLSVQHDIFRMENQSGGGTERKFDPHLRQVSASFSLSSDSWPFRLFGRKADAPATAAPAESAPADSTEASGEDADGITRSVIPGHSSGRSLLSTGPSQPVGSWRGDFSYSLQRPPAGAVGTTNQMLTASLSFQPTEKWNVRWSTGYSFTTREFSDHVLYLTRDLHRWKAHFSFSRTQYGAFTFRFNVQLMDNPDIKFDYDQRSLAPPSQFE